MAVRVTGWEKPFFDYMTAARRRPFEWGRFDCCLFAADVILILTGIDPAADLRGRYRTARGALRIVRKSGGDLDGLATARFPGIGLTPLSSALHAQRGDVLRLKMPGVLPGFGGMGAVCLGPHIACLTEDGLITVSLTAAAREMDATGWRV